MEEKENKLITIIKGIVFASCSFLLGVGFWILIWWEFKMGFAAGSYGGASFVDNPGIFWFFIILQAYMGLMFVLNAVKQIGELIFIGKHNPLDFKKSNLVILPVIYYISKTAAMSLVALFGLWAFVEISVMLFEEILKTKDDMEKIFFGVLAVLIVGLLVYLIYQFVLQPLLKEHFPELLKSVKKLKSKNKPDNPKMK